jgi:hypothetical protein
METHDPETGGRSRRRLLTAAAAGVAAVAAQAAVRPGDAQAANGDAVFLGVSNSATSPTVMSTTAADSTVLEMYALSKTDPALLVNNAQGAATISAVAEGEGQAIVASAQTHSAVSATTASGTSAISGVNTGGGDGVYGQSGTDSFSTTAGAVHGVTSSGNGVAGESGGSGAGVWGAAPGGEGVYGQNGTTLSSSAGLSRAGVHGVSDSQKGTGVWGESLNGGQGVAGSTTSTSTAGVVGQNNGTGYGVRAISNGTGLYANGVVAAIEVIGPALFSSSGIAVVPGSVAAPKSKVIVTGLTLTASSLVLATVQQANGNAVVAQAIPNATAGTLTIVLTEAVTVHVKVGWFVVN